MMMTEQESAASVEGRIYRGSAEDDSLELAVAFGVSPSRIRAGYRLTSKVERDLVVHDLLTVRGPDGEDRPDGLLAYVSFEDPATLALKRVMLPFPTIGGGFIAPRHLSRTLPGKRALDGLIALAVPVREFNPWFCRGRPVYRKATASRLKLVLEYQLAAPVGASAELTRIEVAVSLEEPVPVKRRSDMFEPV